jgi:hypothetical protein
MQFEVEQAEPARPVELESQLLEIAEQRPLFFEQRLNQPTGEIAANLLTLLQARTGPHARGAELAPSAAHPRAVDQLADSRSGQKAIANRNAARK